MSIRLCLLSLLTAVFSIIAMPSQAQDDSAEKHPLASMPLRHIGPAITSGRVSDFAFYPGGDHEFLVAVASGNLWKTNNGGTTWSPIFDNEGSYAIGVVEIDPNDTKTIWVGTGENKAQRSVAYGDGVYKSTDGGKTWNNMGLKDSGHIGKIWINPDNSDEVLVAAQGPLWNDGGDRGLYRTLDGGESWERILEVDEHTGVNEFIVDPRNADVIVASSYQRRRHVWVLINGGPGSGIHKSTDRGKTWTEVTAGLPSDHMGKIGMANAPSAPDTMYAIIEANDEEKGVYRSTDFGSNWTKQSSYMTTSPQYYNELVVDPLNENRVYALNTFTMKSEDGGKNFAPLSLEWRHVDDHALWIDPENTEHLYVGGDGGIYETWDRGNTWRHVRNLSITQFYRIQPDYSEPFYNVCGGTQDNNSLCAPSRTTVVHGITNSDWNIVLGGDGYEPQFDPTNPNIMYAQYQYGGLARYDRLTQERKFIVPHPQSGEDDYKWNWNTPLIVSPHAPQRLYYAAEYLFRSNDRGDSWQKVSPNLTRELDRNQLDVMGRVWGIDTIAKNDSTSIYGSAIGLSESTLQEGLIYIGTDDGVLNVTEDGGETWRRNTNFADVPDMSYFEDVLASSHDADVVYAVFDNHKRGDYKPYVLRSDDRGRSWSSITSNLPERGSAHTIVEDHVDPNLLFVGTEFGLFFSQDRGASWHQLKTNFPTISVRDIEIQARENDLVVGTFGRGIYILDDYTPLRTTTDSLTEMQLFQVRDPWLYIEGDLWDGREKGSMGAEFFTAKNPPNGAVFSYYLKDGVKSRQSIRREQEIEVEKAGGDTPYPDWDDLRIEDRERDPQVYLVVRDGDGDVVRQVKGKAGKGLHRTAWDLRLPAPDPIDLADSGDRPYWAQPPVGPMVLPGEYSARLAVLRDGQLQEVGDSQSFTVKALDASPEITGDREKLQAFQIRVADLRRAVAGSSRAIAEMENRLAHLRAAVVNTPSGGEAERERIQSLATRLADVGVAINGDSTVSGRNEPTPMSIASRTGAIYSGLVFAQMDAGGNYVDSYNIAASEFAAALASLRAVGADIAGLEAALELQGAPWTPGRIPSWTADE
ncbi:MAG: glycosyl hydrolase [Pseudomonadota bacterium]